MAAVSFVFIVLFRAKPNNFTQFSCLDLTKRSLTTKKRTCDK
jgi:hypothetical protein